MLLAVAAALAIEPASPDYPGHCQSPRWSPDGRWLSWEVNYLEKQSVELYVSVFGSSSPPRKVAPAVSTSSITAGFGGDSTARMVVHELTFSPPSLNRFVYASSGTAEDYDLYLDGAGALAAAPGADDGAAWSPDGKSLAFTSGRSGEGDLYLLNLSAPGTPPLKLSGDANAAELYAAWAPNSKSLAFVGHTRKGDSVWLIDDVNFPAPRALTKWSGIQTRPSFSPDGRTLAFYANHDEEARFGLYVAPVDGSAEPKRLVTDVVLNAHGPSWTPDGKALVYVRHDDDTLNPVWRVPVAEPEKAKQLPLGTVGNADLDVVRRPDGKTWVAVAAQGRLGDAVRDFRRVYAMAVE